MLSLDRLGVVVALIAAEAASPALAWVDPRVIQPLNELVVRDPVDATFSQDLEKISSADFSLDRPWINELLFGSSWTDSGQDDSASVSLLVKRVEC